VRRGERRAATDRPAPARRVLLSRYLGPVDDGCTRAQRFQATDDRSYVVKFCENPCGPRALANELIVAGLARLLMAPCPEGVLAEASAILLDDQPDLVASLRATPSAGLHFGSAEVANVSAGLPLRPTKRAPLRVVNASEAPALIVLDAWTRNQDRDGPDNVIFSTEGPEQLRFHGIDHADCFATAAWSAPDLGGLVGSWEGIVDPRIAAMVMGDDAFRPALERLRNVVDETLREIVRQVPESWGLDTHDRDAIVQFLALQRDAVPTLLYKHRHRFPGWTTKGGADGDKDPDPLRLRRRSVRS